MNYGSVLNNGTPYQFMVAPVVWDQTSYQGSRFGNRINITGTGFSSNPNNISVVIAGLPCKVTKASVTQIEVEIPRDFDGNTYGILSSNSTNQTCGFIPGSGFFYNRYDATQMTVWSTAHFNSISLVNE